MDEVIKYEGRCHQMKKFEMWKNWDFHMFWNDIWKSK